MTSGLIPFYQGQDDASISNGSVVCQSPHSVRHTLSQEIQTNCKGSHLYYRYGSFTNSLSNY